MAVQKNRKSRAKRDTRRTHDALTAPTLSHESAAESPVHIRHHLTADGYYRGRKVVNVHRKDST